MHADASNEVIGGRVCSSDAESPVPDVDVKRSFVARVPVNAAALWVATKVVPGVEYSGGWLPFFGVAIVFGLVNTILGTIAKVLTFPLILLTLGVFLLVINGLLLWLTSRISEALELGFRVSGFAAAFWGALVVSAVSALLRLLVLRSEGRTRVKAVRPRRIADN